MGKTDARVDAYIQTLPQWEQNVCHTLRRIIHDVDPEITEVIKRADKPYFVLDGNVCALLGTKTHVNLFIYDPIAADPHGVINQGEGNATARAVQIFEGETIDEAGISALIKAVVANNRAGGWRKVSRADR